MRYGDLLNNDDTLAALGKARFSPEVNLKVARILSRTATLIEDAVAVRKAILEAHAEKDEEGNMVVKDKDQVKLMDPAAYAEDMQALYEAEIPEFPDDDLLTSDDFAKLRDDSLNPENMARLWFLRKDFVETPSTKDSLMSKIPGLNKTEDKSGE